MGKISDALEKSSQIDTAGALEPEAAPTAVEPVELKSKHRKLSVRKRAVPPEKAERRRNNEIARETIAAPDGNDKSSPPHRHQQMPSEAENIDPNLVAITAPHSFEAEQFRLLRTNIMFPPNGTETPRSILVSSIQPGDGKSFVAANLAATIAQNIDRHVLLVDCDLRKPAINRIFGISDESPGLSNYLLEGTPLSHVLMPTVLPRLSILPGGAPPPNPSELLSSNRMEALMQEVLRRYNDRYIIVDSPPPQVAAETTALANFAEGILLVIKMGQTNKDIALQVIEKFGKQKVIGVVTNWLSQRAVSYTGSGRYDQYSYYRRSK